MCIPTLHYHYEHCNWSQAVLAMAQENDNVLIPQSDRATEPYDALSEIYRAIRRRSYGEGRNLDARGVQFLYQTI